MVGGLGGGRRRGRRITADARGDGDWRRQRGCQVLVSVGESDYRRRRGGVWRRRPLVQEASCGGREEESMALAGAGGGGNWRRRGDQLRPDSLGGRRQWRPSAAHRRWDPAHRTTCDTTTPDTLHLQDQFPSTTPTATQRQVRHSSHPHKTPAVAQPFPPRDPHRHKTPATHTKNTTARSCSTPDAHRRTTPIAARRPRPGNSRCHTTPRPARLLRPQEYRRRTPASTTRQAQPRCSHRGTAFIAVRPSPQRNPYPRMIPCAPGGVHSPSPPLTHQPAHPPPSTSQTSNHLKTTLKQP